MSRPNVQTLVSAKPLDSASPFGAFAALAKDPSERGSGPESPFPGSRLLRAYLTEARYESVRAFRMPAFAIPFLLLPVALYLFFGVLLFGSAMKGNPGLAVGTFVAWCVFGVMGPGLFGFGVFVAMEREQGLLTLKRAQPMPPAAYLLAKMLMSLAFSGAILLTLMAAALLVAHPPLPLGRMLGVAFLCWLGALPFCALGLFVGTRVSGKAAPPLVNLIYLPMLYLSGFLFPLPKSIQAIALLSPAFHLDQLALRAAGLPSIGGAAVHVAFLAGLTLLLGWLAARRLASLSL
jgi:ABC-2 type transport system permease protein